MSYANVPQSVGVVVSKRLATTTELQTVLGAQDLYDILEILAVDSFNENLKPREQ